MDKVLNAIGLAYRAKKVVLGEEVLNRIDKVRLIFLASDISEKSRIRFEKKCHFYSIEHIDSYSGEQLSYALGKNNIKVIGITDEGFMKMITKNIEKEENNG